MKVHNIFVYIFNFICITSTIARISTWVFFYNQLYNNNNFEVNVLSHLHFMLLKINFRHGASTFLETGPLFYISVTGSLNHHPKFIKSYFRFFEFNFSYDRLFYNKYAFLYIMFFIYIYIFFLLLSFLHLNITNISILFLNFM